MNATKYARMIETGVAPCGCTVVIDGDTSTVHHDCEPYRQAESEAANRAAAVAHAERNERNQLLNTIPLKVLRKLFADAGGELQERKASKAKAAV